MDLLGAIGMRVDWNLGTEISLSPPPIHEDQEEDEEFTNFLQEFVSRIDPEYEAQLEDMLERAKEMQLSKGCQKTVAEVAMGVVALEIKTQANM